MKRAPDPRFSCRKHGRAGVTKLMARPMDPHRHEVLCRACGKQTRATERKCSRCGHDFTKEEQGERRQSSESVDEAAQVMRNFREWPW